MTGRGGVSGVNAPGLVFQLGHMGLEKVRRFSCSGRRKPQRVIYLHNVTPQ